MVYTKTVILDALTRKIPENTGLVDGWKRVALWENHEPLVAIGAGTPFDDVLTAPVYAGAHHNSPYRGDNVISAAHPEVYVRAQVALQLRAAQQLLPTHLRLVVLDGLRPLDVQAALFSQFVNQFPSTPSTENEKIAERYVSRASLNPSAPAPHTTGGAVDVTLIANGQMINFGTPFDSGSPRAALRFFEQDKPSLSAEEREARSNRRLLYWVMRDAGFEGYQHEWWHFNSPKTQMGAKSAGLPHAGYGYIEPPTNLSRPAAESSYAISSLSIDRIAPCE